MASALGDGYSTLGLTKAGTKVNMIRTDEFAGKVVEELMKAPKV